MEAGHPENDGVSPKKQENVHENKTVCNRIGPHSVSGGGIKLLKNTKIRNWGRISIHAYVVGRWDGGLCWGWGCDKIESWIQNETRPYTGQNRNTSPIRDKKGVCTIWGFM